MRFRLAAISAHGRRRQAEAEELLLDGQPVPTATLNLRRMTLAGPAGEVPITDGAATLLSVLALAPGRRLAHWQLIEALREDADQYTVAALGVRVVRLRQLLRRAGFDGLTVQALRLEGYQLCLAVTVV